MKMEEMGRKHCGKRKNCSVRAVRAISPFPPVFKKQTCTADSRKNQGLFGKGLNIDKMTISIFDTVEKLLRLLDSSKLKEFAEDNFKLDENGRKSSNG